MTGIPSEAFSRALWKTNVALRLPDVLIEQLRALDVEEEGAAFLSSGALGDLLGQ
jgi:hypothetical protein